MTAKGKRSGRKVAAQLVVVSKGTTTDSWTGQKVVRRIFEVANDAGGLSTAADIRLQNSVNAILGFKPNPNPVGRILRKK